MNSKHKALLHYTSVRWLSRGIFVFEMKDKIKSFLEAKNETFSYFSDEPWMKSLAYLTDIFKKVNGLNIKLQGKETNITQLRDCLMAFCSKLQNWRQRIMQGNIAMFNNLSGLFREHVVLDEPLKTLITQHLQSLQTELTRCFPQLKKNIKL